MRRIGQRTLPSMKEAISDVWQAIGRDILQSWDTEDGESPDLTGKDVQEVVVDHLDTYMPAELMTQYRNATREQRHAWLEEAFPSTSHYGY